jgi:hypothetical protein
VGVGVEGAAGEGEVDVVAGLGAAGGGVAEEDDDLAVVGGDQLDVDELADVALEEVAGDGAVGLDHLAHGAGDGLDGVDQLDVAGVDGARVALHDLGDLGEQAGEDEAVDLLAGGVLDALPLDGEADALGREGGDADDLGGHLERRVADGEAEVDLARGMNLGLGQGDEGTAVGDVEHLAVTEAGDGA